MYYFYRCNFFNCDTMSRSSSDSSLNEFIKQKMQNRPPCYDDIEKDRKVPIVDTNQVCVLSLIIIHVYVL